MVMQDYTNQQTLGQLRARQAWDDISNVRPGYAKNYASLVRGFPAMIQSDGLGPSLAFLRAKGEDHHLALYGHLSAWIMGQLAPDAGVDLHIWLLGVGSYEYRRAAAEAQAYLGWLKRFAEAEIGEGEE